MNGRLPSYISVPLSNAQKGAIGQFAFLSTALATGKGQVEAYTPVADNEQRDAEIRRHMTSAAGIGIQVKVAFALSKLGRPEAKYLNIAFDVAESHVQRDRRFWYFFAFYDTQQLRLHDPAYLIPCDVVYRTGRHGKPEKGRITFSIEANVDPNSRDKWSGFRVAPKDLGMRLLEIVDEVGQTALRVPPPVPVDGVWLSRAVPGGVKKTLRAASTDRSYDLIRNAVLERQSLTGWYKGHLHLFSPFVLGSKAGERRVLGYQFAGTSEKALAPDGSPQNWRCLRVAELTELTAIPGIWHGAPVGNKGHQHCIDQVDVTAFSPPSAAQRFRRAA